ncbi:hypothetical protein OMF39_21035, partial [Bordetella pertussis]
PRHRARCTHLQTQPGRIQPIDSSQLSWFSESRRAGGCRASACGLQPVLSEVAMFEFCTHARTLVGAGASANQRPRMRTELKHRHLAQNRLKSARRRTASARAARLGKPA